MASGNEIIVSASPKGCFIEGIVSGTPKPGTCMQIQAGTAAVNGRFTWEVFNQAADGTRSLVAVLLPDVLQGKTKDDAYVTATRCFLYCPIMGEELNMIVEDISGTGADQDFTVGDRLMINDGTGKLVDSSGSEGSTPFICLETFSDLAADYHAHCMYTGY